MRREIFVTAVCAVASAAAVAGQTRAAKIHRLEATPSTVAYGYDWAGATPALRIASGDIVDVDTLLTKHADWARARRRGAREKFRSRSSGS